MWRSGLFVAMGIAAALSSNVLAYSPTECRNVLCAGSKCSPLKRTVVVDCRDGDPRCDRDNSCDRACTITECLIGGYFKGCPSLSVGFCEPIMGSDLTQRLKVGEHTRDVLADHNILISSKLIIRCVRAAPGCNYALPGDRFSSGN